MEENQNHLGAAIKAARISKHMTQNQLATELHITTRHIMAIENGSKKPSYDLLFRLIRKLEISADTIFYPGYENKDSMLGKIRLLLNQYEESEIDAMVTALISLLATNDGMARNNCSLTNKRRGDDNDSS